ncbi:hypothetical protein BD414DRAFT_405010 [Trametes punicea]|nr:hypothetical protein BD414DRAFT_405010 [Trametes punicea]
MRLVPGLASIFALLYLVSNCYSCGTITVDNADPRILYEGFWQASTVPGPGKNDLQNTLAFSDQSLATAILQFPGTSVSVYGALLPVGVWYMQSVYYLDAMQSAVHEPDPVVTAEQHRVLFYSSGPLTYGVHTLVIENVGQQFWLDYITFDVPDDDLAMPCTTAAIASATVAPVYILPSFAY